MLRASWEDRQVRLQKICFGMYRSLDNTLRGKCFSVTWKSLRLTLLVKGTSIEIRSSNTGSPCHLVRKEETCEHREEHEKSGVSLLCYRHTGELRGNQSFYGLDTHESCISLKESLKNLANNAQNLIKEHTNVG